MRNEFATVLVATDNSANGCRLLIRDLHRGTEVYLDPLELEALLTPLKFQYKETVDLWSTFR